MKAKKIILNFIVLPVVILLLVLVAAFFLVGNSLIKNFYSDNPAGYCSLDSIP